MHITEIRDRYDADGGEGVVAILLMADRQSYEAKYSPGIHFITKPTNPLQVAVMSRAAGEIVKPHIHPARQRIIHSTGEVFIVRSGQVIVDLYNSSKQYLDSKFMNPGDVLIAIAGGHAFTFVEDSEVIEVKQGPYDSELDKIVFTYDKET